MNDCLHNYPNLSCNDAPEKNSVFGVYSDTSLFGMHAVNHDEKGLFFARFFFDNIFFIFVVIVTISMVAGKIIFMNKINYL